MRPRTNPVSSWVEGLNQGIPDYKSGTLTTQLHCCLAIKVQLEKTVALNGLSVYRSYSFGYPNTCCNMYSKYFFISYSTHHSWLKFDQDLKFFTPIRFFFPIFTLFFSFPFLFFFWQYSYNNWKTLT